MAGLRFFGSSEGAYRSRGHQRSSPFKPAANYYSRTSLTEKLSESSTPHAPRHKRPASSPSNDVIKHHARIDKVTLKNGLVKTRIDENSPPRPLSASKQPPSVKRAWTNGERHQTTPPKVVQPFRRTVGRTAPHGVPLLDLSKLNEPDEKLQPVKLLEMNDIATQRSLVSWGGHYCHLSPPNGHMTSEDDHMTAPNEAIEDAEPGEDPGLIDNISSERVLTPSIDKLPHAKSLETNQLEYVEAKLLSHERARRSTSPSTKPPLSLPAQSTSYPSMLKNSLGVPETSISKRLRFEARILTQHGRDVHRELCGFFFLVDNSITIYEYRQFGKKSSALPLIQRRCYTHLIGRRKGQPLEVNFIRKGSVLHFRSRDHPGLPSSLCAKPLIALMVTSVDEKIKKDLLCAGKNPVEYHKIDVYLNAAPPPDEEKDRLLLSTLQGMLCSRLRGRGKKTLVGVGRELSRLADADGVISEAQLQQTLRKYHISLTVEDMDLLCRLLVAMEMTPPTESGLYVDGCVPALIGRMSEDRLALIRTLFHRLDAQKSGTVFINDVNKFFNRGYVLHLGKGQRSTADVWEDLQECLFDTTNTISYADLEHYYLGVSIETVSDSEFYTLLRHCWTL